MYFPSNEDVINENGPLEIITQRTISFSSGIFTLNQPWVDCLSIVRLSYRFSFCSFKFYNVVLSFFTWICLPSEYTFISLSVLRLYGVPFLDIISKDVRALFFQLKSGAKLPLSQTPSNMGLKQHFRNTCSYT